MHNFITIDVETGGFEKDLNPITEVACVAINGKTLEIIKPHTQFYVQPYNGLKIEQQALNNSRVTMAQVNGGLLHKDAVKQLIEVFKAHKSKGKGDSGLPRLVGHNFGFDIGFLEYIFEYNKKNIYDYVHKLPLCTMELAKNHYGYTGKKVKLGDVCEHFGITLTNAHSALPDTLATAKCFIKFMEMLRGGTAGAGKTVKASKFGIYQKFQF